MFKDLRGFVLIRLTTVCRNFNSVIGASSKLMEKIRLRVPDPKDVAKLEIDLCASKRRYNSISIARVHKGTDIYASFAVTCSHWLSLKLSSCRFEFFTNPAPFLSLFTNITELEIDNDCDGPSLEDGSVHSICIPSLRKLKAVMLTVDLICEKLTHVELQKTHGDFATRLLVRNPILEELNLYRQCLLHIDLSRVRLHVTRLSIKSNSKDELTLAEISFFERFLITQSAVKELTN